MTSDALVNTQGLHHVRVTVTDIAQSKAFYSKLFGAEPAIDMSDHAGEPGVSEDQSKFYGGCIFSFGNQLFGLRPVASAGDRFDSTRVGLDHVSFGVADVSELEAAAERLTQAGVEHGEINRLEDAGMAILSIQDPDGINLELVAGL